MDGKSRYIVEGSAVRKVESIPERYPEKAPQRPGESKRESRRSIDDKTDRALAFDLKYTLFVTFSAILMIAAGVTVLYFQSEVEGRKENIDNLESQLEVIANDNTAYKLRLESMYSMDQLYDIAVNELGMVYAHKGQIVYYDSADDDYVNQFQDVPGAE